MAGMAHVVSHTQHVLCPWQVTGQWEQFNDAEHTQFLQLAFNLYQQGEQGNPESRISEKPTLSVLLPVTSDMHLKAAWPSVGMAYQKE